MGRLVSAIVGLIGPTRSILLACLVVGVIMTSYTYLMVHR